MAAAPAGLADGRRARRAGGRAKRAPELCPARPRRGARGPNPRGQKPRVGLKPPVLVRSVHEVWCYQKPRAPLGRKADCYVDGLSFMPRTLGFASHLAEVCYFRDLRCLHSPSPKQGATEALGFGK